MQAGNEIDAVSIVFSQNNVMPSQNNVMPSRHVTCGLIEAMVDGELRYIIGGRSNGGMGGLTGELPARRFDAERGDRYHIHLCIVQCVDVSDVRRRPKVNTRLHFVSWDRFLTHRKLLWSNRLLLSSYLRGQVNVYHLTRTSVFDPRRAVTYLPH